MSNDFKNKLNLCISKIEKENWDILYLGHHLWKECVDDNVYSNSLEPTIKQYNRMESMKISMGGTGGYLINKKGPDKLLEFININGMTNGIDGALMIMVIAVIISMIIMMIFIPVKTMLILIFKKILVLLV